MITFTEAQLNAWIAPLLWPFLRALALFSALPIFNRQSVPLRVRVDTRAEVEYIRNRGVLPYTLRSMLGGGPPAAAAGDAGR